MLKKYLLVFALGVLFSSAFFAVQGYVQTTYQPQVITVHSGDTLWEIAVRWSDKNEDVREVIDRIMQANKLTDATSLVAGQKLIVPVKGLSEKTKVVAEAR